MQLCLNDCLEENKVFEWVISEEKKVIWENSAEKGIDEEYGSEF